MLGIHARPVINRLFLPLGTRLVAWGVTLLVAVAQVPHRLNALD